MGYNIWGGLRLLSENRLNLLQLHEQAQAELQLGHSHHCNFSPQLPKTVQLHQESLVWTDLY